MNNREERKIFWILSVIHITVMIALLIGVVLSGMDYNNLLLIDDGYYDIAGRIVDGRWEENWVGLGYPLILTILYILPVFLHPFIRLGISILITIFTLKVLFKITDLYNFSIKEKFWGGLIFILNPLYLHWMFKSRVEAPLVLFLGLFILYSLLYYRSLEIKHLLLAMLFMVLGIFTKPIFMLAPTLIIVSFIFIKKRGIFYLGFAAFIISISSFYAMKNISDNSELEDNDQYYQVPSIVSTSFYVNSILSNRDFKSQYRFIEKDSLIVRNTRFIVLDRYYETYEEKYGNLEPIKMSIRFIADRPGMVLKAVLANVFFAYSLSGSELETLGHFLINTIFILIAFLGLLRVKESHKHELFIQLSIIISIWLLLVLVHSRAPYFIPIIPYLFVFGGIKVNSIIEKTRIDNYIDRFIK